MQTSMQPAPAVTIITAMSKDNGWQFNARQQDGGWEMAAAVSNFQIGEYAALAFPGRQLAGEISGTLAIFNHNRYRGMWPLN